MKSQFKSFLTTRITHVSKHQQILICKNTYSQSGILGRKVGYQEKSAGVYQILQCYYNWQSTSLLQS